MATKRSVLGKLVSDLAESLQETQPAGIFTLVDIACTLGEKTCRRLVAETFTIQAKGGMWRADGSQRTLGGIFMYLASQVPGDRETSVLPASQPANNDIAALLRTIAACAYEAAAMIPGGPNSIPEAAQQRINNLRSMWGSLAAALKMGKAATPIRSGKTQPTKPKIKALKRFGAAPAKKKLAKSVRKFSQISARQTPQSVRVAPPNLGFARPAYLASGTGFIVRGVGGKKPGSHREGRHG
ncbi:MAG TPA: hypothetical protein VH475_26725 [Tepidisphaeraceae bacterium]